MHVELSLDAQNNPAQQDEEQSRSEDTQTIAGSQVACAFARIKQEQVDQSQQSRFQVLAVAMLAVFAVVAIYLVFVLAF